MPVLTSFWDVLGVRLDAWGHIRKMPVIENPMYAREPISDREQKLVALGYLQEAWAEARHDGIDGDCLAQACLFAAIAEFVTTYGEEAAATFTDGLSTRIRKGEFTLEQPRQ
jgi:hypothetical protein